MFEHFILTLDRDCLRIFSGTARVEADSGVMRVEVIELSERESAPKRGSARRLDRGNQNELAAQCVNKFLASHPEATWDFSADGNSYAQVLRAVGRDHKRRLRQAQVRSV